MNSEIPYHPLPRDLADVRYAHGPDSLRHDEVPAGTIHPVTSRVQAYEPAGYDPRQPAALVVFLDGSGFLDPDDEMRAATVLDNLIHAGDLPATVGVFVDPGDGTRNAEYDAGDGRYATHLVDEVLPEVTARWPVTDDHDRWAVCGFSSGGNAALTAAWHRPDAFRRVIALSSSFAQMPGGNPYPALAAEPHEPLRVFLQVGHRDLGWDEPAGSNWFAETLRTAAALAENGHDVRLLVGDGGHDGNHGGVHLPDALRWVFGPRSR